MNSLSSSLHKPCVARADKLSTWLILPIVLIKNYPHSVIDLAVTRVFRQNIICQFWYEYIFSCNFFLFSLIYSSLIFFCFFFFFSFFLRCLNIIVVLAWCQNGWRSFFPDTFSLGNVCIRDWHNVIRTFKVCLQQER